MKIDKETSYMIGFFQTDGNLYQQKNTKYDKGKASIEISEKDIDILEKLSNIIPYYSSIRKRNRDIIMKGKNYNFNSVNLTICNKEFRKFLNENGVPYGKKSKIIKPPHNIIREDYIRGLIDGDGSLGFIKNGNPFVTFVSESDDVIGYLLDYISDITGNEKKTMNRNNRDGIYNVMIKNEDAMVFCDNIYYNNCLSLDRKYKISQDIKKWKRPEGEFKVTWQRRRWTDGDDDFILNHDIYESMEKLDRTEKSIKMRLIRLENNHKY